MKLRHFVHVAIIAVGIVTVTASVFTQQAPTTGPAGGRAAGAGQAGPRPQSFTLPLMFKEEWRKPREQGSTGPRKAADTMVNPNLELKLYGGDTDKLGIIGHSGLHDYAAKSEPGGNSLWTGHVFTPIAILLRDKNNFADLTALKHTYADPYSEDSHAGLARLRTVMRTDGLHRVYPALKLADGTLIAANRPYKTDGFFLTVEVLYGGVGLRWYRVDPKTVTTNTEVKNPDLSKVDEVGWVELMPAGGAGLPGGWVNISTMELYAKPVPR